MSRAQPGDEVEVWFGGGGRHRRGRLVRWNKAGNPVIRIERVDHKGTPLGTYGSERVFSKYDLIGGGDQ